MKRWIAVALLSSAVLAHAQTPAASPAKKELVAKLLQLQQPGIENLARMIAERPVGQLMQQASNAMQGVPQEKREAVGKSLQADAQKFMEEAVPVVRDHALKLVPQTVGPVMEEKFSEDELKQLIAWYESPVKKKYDSLGGEMQGAVLQKLVGEAAAVLDPKLKALQLKMGETLRAASASGGASAPKPAASGAKPAAAKPAAKAASK